MDTDRDETIIMQEEKNIASFDVRNFFKRWPKFYYFIGTVFGPLMFCNLSAKDFLRKYPKTGRTLNIGSGPRIISSEVENVDIYPYAGVSIVSDATHIPLPEGGVARIISDNVLEHVKRPHEVVKEMHRLLEVGGVAYVAVPFLYPFHSSPSDYQRYSAEGLKELFSDFEVVESGVRAGPFSAITVYLNHLFAFMFSFGSRTLESLLLNCVMFFTFPIKLPDIVFSHFPRAEETAAVLYCVVKKK